MTPIRSNQACPHCGKKALSEYHFSMSVAKILDLGGMVKKGLTIQKQRIRRDFFNLKEADVAECLACKGLSTRCPHCKKITKLHGTPKEFSDITCSNCGKSYGLGHSGWYSDWWWDA